jgi:hypothetical protein
VICFFPLKELQSQQIQIELSDWHDEQAIQLLAVEKWHLRFGDRAGDLEDAPRSRRHKKTDFVSPITELLRKKPFHSCKAIWRRLKTPKKTSLRVLPEGPELTKFHLHRVPQTLVANQMAERVALSYQLLQALRSDEEQNFKTRVARDKSWFFLETSVRSGWSRSRDDLPSRPKQNIQTERVSFQSFGLFTVSVSDLLFRTENITIQHSSSTLVFPMCKQTFAQEYEKDTEMLDRASGQRTRAQIKAFSRSFRSN